jgi:hypothetical protein
LPPPGRQNTINPDSVIRNSGAVANAGDATVADGKPPGDGVSGTQVLPPPGKIGNDEIGRGHWKMLIGSKSGTVDQIGAKETGDTTKTTGGEQTGGAGTQKINGNLGSDLKIDPPPGGGGGKDGTGTDSNSGAKSTGDVDVRQGHYFALAGKTKLSAGDAGGDLAAAGPDADGTGSIGTNDGAKSTGGVGTEQGHYFALAGKTKLSAGDAGGDLAAAGPDAGSTGTNRVVVQAEAVAASDLTVPVRLQQIHLLGRPELTAVNIQQSTAGGLIDAFAEDRGDGKPADAPKRNLIPSQLFNAAYAPPQEVTQSRSATFRPVERTA